jgi:hypothetical protein
VARVGGILAGIATTFILACILWPRSASDEVRGCRTDGPCTAAEGRRRSGMFCVVAVGGRGGVNRQTARWLLPLSQPPC